MEFYHNRLRGGLYSVGFRFSVGEYFSIYPKIPLQAASPLPYPFGNAARRTAARAILGWIVSRARSSRCV